MSNTNVPPVWEARDNGITWLPGAAQTVQNRTTIDPTTGQLVGPDSLIPGNLGLQYQAEHDRRVWDYRQRLMQDATNYGRGALGLMQSFRPGGGATIEAGQYNTLAQIQLNRAQMTQPMDLLGDYRRHEQAVARQKANRQAATQQAIQIGVALAGIAATAMTGGAAAAIMPALGAAAGAAGGGGAAPAAGGTASGAGAGGAGPMTGAAAAAASGAAASGQAAQQSAQQGQALSGMAAPSQGAPPQQGNKQVAPAALGQGYGQGQPQQPAGGPQGGRGAQIQGQGGQATAGGAGGPTPGADGVFTPQSYAAAGQASGNPVQRAVLTQQFADLVDNDPFYDAFSYAVNARFAQRMRVA